jgi:hypothetical protein
MEPKVGGVGGLSGSYVVLCCVRQGRKVARSPKMPGQAQGRHVASIFEQREVGRLPTVGGEEGNGNPPRHF